MKYKSSVIKKRYCVEDMISVMSCFDLCIGMRLHTLIYAAVNAIPVIGLVYDPKISSFMDYTHQKHHIEVDKLSSDNLIKMLDECVANYDELKKDLLENYSELKKKAMLNGSLAVELYEKGSVAI